MIQELNKRPCFHNEIKMHINTDNIPDVDMNLLGLLL